MRRGAILVALLCCCALLGGCWDYRGLNEINIVAGLAVDREGPAGNYLLTFEIIDTLKHNKEGELNVVCVDSEGETLFDAIRNAKKKLINKLYGGNMQTLVISKQIAETEGVLAILEELLRDGEPRETMSVVISQEETARQILQSKVIDAKIVSYKIHDGIEKDNQITASTVDMPLYQAYNAIKGVGNALVLPAVRCVENSGDTVVECNGIALFQGDRLIGFLSPEKTMGYLFIKDRMRGSAISFPHSNPDQSISIEVKKSKTHTDVSFEDGQLYVDIAMGVKLNLMEVKSQLQLSQKEEREALERQAEAFLQDKIVSLFHEAQSQIKTDIFGLGRLLYQKEPELWRSLEGRWDELFQSAQLRVLVEADILAAGVLKDY